VNRRDFLVAAATAPLALRLAPEAFARSLGGTPLALVTADTESRIVAFDLDTHVVFRTVPTLPGPRSIESVSGRTAVIAHTAGGAVSLLDGPTLTVRHVLRDFAEPRYTAAHPDGRHAFVTDSKRGEVVALDVLTGRVVGRAAMHGPARHVSIDPAGRTLWVSLGSKAEHVAIVDVSNVTRPRLLRTIRPPFLAHDVGFFPDGRHVWTTSGDRGAMAVYDARHGDLLRRLPADAPPQHVTFLQGLAFVTSGDDGTLRVHRLRDGHQLGLARVPVGSYNVQQGFGLILTPSLDRGTLCVLDRRGRIQERRRLAASSHDACFVMAA
jgi:DNA-binding beta-propeller fold protein YncE